MLFYFPESKGQIDTVGYNNAIRLVRKALFSFFTDFRRNADFRMYCNLPWHHNPQQLKDGKPLFVYTMYESTRVPSGWVRFLNKHADVIAVPSEFCKHAFIASGVKRPIGIMGLGVDPSEMSPAFKTNYRDDYIFLWQGVAYDPNGRKGVDMVVRAFNELRVDGLLEHARLILKYRPTYGLVLEGITSPNRITYLQKELTREGIFELYKMVDCCVNPTRGEGFGLIPLEQMAMGKPVILTGFSMPYLEYGSCLAVNYRLEKSPVTWNHKSIILSKNGIAFNLGGLYREFCWLPKLIHKMPDGGRVRSIPDRKVSFRDKVIAKINNAAADVQAALHLIPNPKHHGLVFQLEDPGKDATVNLQDLKTKMLWCYNNRREAEKIGIAARQCVMENWTLERIKKDFHNNILPLLEKELICRKH
jgi:hypothetical protein